MTEHAPVNEALRDGISNSIDAVLKKIDRLFDAARPEAVFAPPLTAEGRTIIGASEVFLWAGVGGGGGMGPAVTDERAPLQVDEGGLGAGAGGGGIVHGRPVAVVIVDGDGVRVEPVVDATKIGLAALTVLGSALVMLFRIWRGARRVEQ